MRINQQLGLRPNTRKRLATKSAAIVSSAQCERCQGRHVIQATIHGRVQQRCGFCGHTWYPPQPAAPTRQRYRIYLKHESLVLEAESQHAAVLAFEHARPGLSGDIVRVECLS